MPWHFHEVADAVGEVLRRAEDDLRLEQAVYGLDAMRETALQSVVADGLRGTGFCEVTREVHYPSDVGKKQPGRRRCDLVLTPPGRPLRVTENIDLFSDPHACPAGEALWLEMKVAHQFAEGGRRHTGYGEQWRNATVRDLRKMEEEAQVRDAGLLLVVFTSGPDVVRKDLELFEDVLARREVLAGFRQVRELAILERNGHRCMSAALWPTVQRSPDTLPATPRK